MKQGVSDSIDFSATGTVASKSANNNNSSSNNNDVEKIRNFYTKKMADMDKKHEASLRAAKRGSGLTSNTPPLKVDKNNAVDRVRELESLVSKQKEMIMTLETVKGPARSSSTKVASENKIGQLEQRNKYVQIEIGRPYLDK